MAKLDKRKKGILTGQWKEMKFFEWNFQTTPILLIISIYFGASHTIMNILGWHYVSKIDFLNFTNYYKFLTFPEICVQFQVINFYRPCEDCVTVSNFCSSLKYFLSFVNYCLFFGWYKNIRLKNCFFNFFQFFWKFIFLEKFARFLFFLYKSSLVHPLPHVSDYFYSPPLFYTSVLLFCLCHLVISFMTFICYVLLPTVTRMVFHWT